MLAQYPVSCSPQAWAAGSVFLILQSLLGLRADAANKRLFLRPTLPDRIGALSVRNLRIGEHRVDLDLRRERDRVVVEASSVGSIDVVVESAVSVAALRR